jgi:hypothetical protein
VWHLFPRRSWPWLLLAGAASVAPLVVLRLVPDLYGGWMTEPLVVLTTSAPSLTLVGILGGATVVWQAGRHGAGAALIGTALVIQLIGPLVMASVPAIGSVLFLSTAFFQWLSTVLVVVAMAGAIGAVVASRTGRPAVVGPSSWRVTIAGALVAASPVVLLWWRPEATGSLEDRAAAATDYLLYLGLGFLAGGLVAGAFAGTHALLASATAGLLLGSFGMLIVPSARVLQEITVITTIAALASMIIGYLVALSRWRERIAVTGLTLVVLGLLLLYVVFNRDDPPNDDSAVTRILTPTLMVIGIIAAVAAIAAAGSAPADRGDAPAVLAGLTNAFSLATICLIANISITTAPEDRAPIVGLLPPVIGGAFIAVLLITMRLRAVGWSRLRQGS